MRTTINPEEVEKFSAIADEWWDKNGKFAPLHRINPVRVDYIRQQVEGHLNASDAPMQLDAPHPLGGVHLLDIGCGGGLVCEEMARLGAKVTGVDASEKNIQIARLHAETSGLSIDYQSTTAEALSEKGEQYDVVLALEIIEHVANVDLLIASVMQLVRPGGIAIFSTINRTPKAFALAILGAEYVLRWLPRGTHDWQHFVTPSELRAPIERSGATIVSTTGMVMNPLTFEWRLKPADLSVNYLLTAKIPEAG